MLLMGQDDVPYQSHFLCLSLGFDTSQLHVSRTLGRARDLLQNVRNGVRSGGALEDDTL
jgi:hypothetical protein